MNHHAKIRNNEKLDEALEELYNAIEHEEVKTDE
jgi:hypothetical protein